MKQVKRTTHKEDPELVTFLKTYHPITPSESQLSEDNLMQAITQEKQTSNFRSHQRGWLFPSAVITLLALMISGNAMRGKLMPRIAQEMKDLETFMVNSWNGSMAQNDESELYFVTLESEF